MKKFMLIISLVIFIAFLSGCAAFKKLDVPTKLRIENKCLYWNIVDGAEKYVVSVDGNEYIVVENYYNLAHLENKENGYTLAVKAMGSGFVSNSDYSGPILYLPNDSSGGNTNQESNKGETISFTDINKSRFLGQKNESYESVLYSFTDTRNNYFYFYLGYVEKVPVAYEPAAQWKGDIKPKLTYAITSYEEQQISESMSNCISNTVTESTEASIEASLGIKAKVVEANVSVGLAQSVTSSSSRSTTKTSSSVTKWSEQHVNQIEYELDDSCQYGYYRYTLFATCDIYAVVVYDKVEKTINYDYISCARSNTYFFGIDYSTTEYFESDENAKKLEFDLNILKNIDLAADLPNIGNQGIELALPVKQTVLSNSKSIKVVASGNYFNDVDDTDWGLSHDYDTIDLSKYSKYMNSKYIWTFQIMVEIEEENDGYQEIYLYNQNIVKGSVSSSDTYSESDALNSGLLKYNQDINKSWKANDHFTTDLYFEVAGGDCRNTMYIKYGAHGEFSDDWYKRSIKVLLTIIEKQ